MTSFLSWIDFDQTEQDRLKAMLGMFRDESTVDEIGAGSLRDAIADILFPGTSTLHTHVKYMLFVPWLCLRLERSQKSSGQEFRYRLDRSERNLIRVLSQTGDLGVIGGTAPDTVKRLPSELYWGGLRRWGILKTDTSLSGYVRSLDVWKSRRDVQVDGDDVERVRQIYSGAWHPSIARLFPGKDFPGQADFHLSLEEAECLRALLQHHCSGTLLSFLCEIEDPGEVEGPWDLATKLPNSPHGEACREVLRHARIFSIVVHAAMISYTMHCATGLEATEYLERLKPVVSDWRRRAEQAASEISQWDISRLFAIGRHQNPRISVALERFVGRWRDHLLRLAFSEESLGGEAAGRLIRDRELEVKGRGRARLADRRVLERWDRAGLPAPLTFRWFNAQRFVREIREGMTQ